MPFKHMKMMIGGALLTLLIAVGLVGVVVGRQNNLDTRNQASGGSTAATVGIFDPSTMSFLLKLTGGSQLHVSVAGAPWNDLSLYPVAGNWTGAGTTVGLYHSTTGQWLLKSANDDAAPDTIFVYGPAPSHWWPITGDWTGQGKTTIGLYDRSTSTFYLRNKNSQGNADIIFQFGNANGNYIPVTGDWTGQGKTTVGLYDTSTAIFYLRNSNSRGNADITFQYGNPSTGWLPITGDWTNQHKTGVGLYDAVHGIFYLRNTLSTGVNDTAVVLSNPGTHWLPVAGAWLMNGGGGGAAAASVAGTSSQSCGSYSVANCPIGSGCFVQIENSFCAAGTGYCAGNDSTSNQFCGNFNQGNCQSDHPQCTWVTSNAIYCAGFTGNQQSCGDHHCTWESATSYCEGTYNGGGGGSASPSPTPTGGGGGGTGGSCPSGTTSGCDNGVAIGGTACNHNGDSVQYQCGSGSCTPNHNNWVSQACPGGQTCQGTHCQGSGGGGGGGNGGGNSCPWCTGQGQCPTNAGYNWSGNAAGCGGLGCCRHN